MNDPELDELLTRDGERWRRRSGADANRELATAVARASEPTLTVTPTRRRVRSRWSLPLLAAAIVGIAVTVHLVTPAQRHSLTPAAPAPTPAALTVNYLGLTLDLPSDWRVQTGPFCDRDRLVAPNTLTIDTLTPGGLIPHCPSRPASTPQAATPNIALGQLTADQPQQLGQSRTKPMSIEVAGLDAERSQGSVAANFDQAAGHADYVEIPALDLSITFNNLTPPTIQSILDSARVTPVDPLGCRDRVASLTPTTNAPATSVLPAGAVSAITCEYLSEPTPPATYHLIGSRRLSGNELVRIESWAAGASQSPSAPDGRIQPDPPTLYVLTYADGSTRTLKYSPGQALLTDGHLTVGTGNFDQLLPLALAN